MDENTGPIEAALINCIQEMHGQQTKPTEEQLVRMTGLSYSDLRLADAAPELMRTLKLIKGWPGNLPDESLMTKTGPNDAAHRGMMVCAMREFATIAIDKVTP